MQAVWDELWGGGARFNDVAGAGISRTTRGVVTRTVKPGVTTEQQSGLMMCQITELFGAVDYFGVKRFDGSTQSGDQLLVAKSIPARPSTGPYSYSASDDNNRTSNDGTTVEIQVMMQPFGAGDVVFVGSADHTGIVVSGTEITLLEMNTEREWVKEYIP